MEARSSKVRYCKLCSKKCIKLVSHTRMNPGREYFSCPTPMMNGRHGWIEWVDKEAFPNDTSRRSARVGESTMEDLEQLTHSRARVRILEEHLDDEVEISIKLRLQLVEEQVKTKCLMNCLKSIVTFVLLYVIVVWISA